MAIFLRGVPEFLKQLLLSVIRHNRSSIAASLRRKAYRTLCEIDTDVIITNPRLFQAAKGCALYHGSYILNPHGSVSLGEDSHMGAYCFVNACYGKVEIGSHVAIGPGTTIFSYSNHYASTTKVTEERITLDVVIGNNVFIGSNCSILPGTTIHDNVIVGAGSVVKGSLESNCIFAGVPCKKIRKGWHE
jgi:galactoside O-acetyltransferase